MIGYSRLPPHMQQEMKDYIEDHVPTGDFLQRVLSNDLMGALNHADNINKYALSEYGMFLVNQAPRECYGGPHKFTRWVAMSSFNQGDKVLYVPVHAHGDTRHPDCVSGTVTSKSNICVFVRFMEEGDESGEEMKDPGVACDPLTLVHRKD